MSGQRQKEPVADINNLQETLNKQQKKISALKELVRKSDSTQGKSSTSEKAKTIAQRLINLKAKAQGGRHQKQHSSEAACQEDLSEAQMPAMQDNSLIDSPEMHQGMSIPTFQNIEVLSTTLPGIVPTVGPQIPSKHSAFAASPLPLRAQQRSISNTSLSGASTGTEKLLLLRQQMEENKALMARRASSKQHLEQLVSQLKENFDSTQQSLENTTTELGRSMNDLSAVSVPSYSAQVSAGNVSASTASRDRHRSATDLSTQSAFSLERERIKFLENRCRLLEKQLEKERLANETSGNASGSSAETAAAMEISSKRIKELENKVIELEQAGQDNALQSENERLRNELTEFTKRQEVIGDTAVELSDLAVEVSMLREENTTKSKRIADLEEINDLLETTRCDLSSKLNSYEIKIQELEAELKRAEDSLATTTSELERLKSEDEPVSLTEEAREAHVMNTDAKVQAEMAKQIQELQDESKRLLEENEKLLSCIAESEKLEVTDNQIAEKIKSLEATLESQREDLTLKLEINRKQEEELMEKTAELNVLKANFRVLEEKLQTLSKNKSKPLFASQSATDSTLSEAGTPDQSAEIEDLKQKLDEANKFMIKLKLKVKQSEKQVEQLKKSSDLHADLINLQKKNEELQQRISELENVSREKTEKKPEDSREKENSLVRQLELEKSQLLDELAALRKSHEDLQHQERVVVARVETELNEIHLEEQVTELQEENAMLGKEVASKTDELSSMAGQLEQLRDQKQTLEKKLQHYISENIELLDKVEKLSKSSSSAESIEIVDRLTQQEHAEMAEFNKRLATTIAEGGDKELTSANLHEHQQQHLTVPDVMSTSAPSMTTSLVNELTQTDMGIELSESLTKLREESSELMGKVEMFTRERREVLDKMELLRNENVELQNRIETLSQEKNDIETELLAAAKLQQSLETQLDEVCREKDVLASQIAETSAQKSDLSRELTSMQKSSEIVAALDNTEACSTLFDKCEKSLTSLQTELEAYKRAHDKNSKFNASKKLAKEAKNAHTQLSELLLKVKEASTAVETVTVVETVVAVTAPNGKALAEYEQLTAQNRELKNKVDELQRKYEMLESTRESSTETVEDEIASSSTATTTSHAAEHEEALKRIQDYETECAELKAKVDELTAELREVNADQEVKLNEITRLNDELNQMQKMSEDFDDLINQKEMSHEQQIEKFTRLHKELEAKCDTYKGEMDILKTLVAEQKQQLIEAYKEQEYEVNMKLLDLQQRDELITHLRNELEEMRKHTQATGVELTDNLQKECEKLREALRINKKLLAEQVDELSNKQETIDTLNQQIIDLYKTMEENTNKLIEKEDELADLQEQMDRNAKELERLRKDNEEQKAVVDKLLLELHTERESSQRLKQLEGELSELKATNKDLEEKNHAFEQRNKEQLEKLKKFAANLKKRVAQCQELEAKVKVLEEKESVGGPTTSEGELQQDLEANVVLLNERIADYEMKLKSSEGSLLEVQEALQAKTVEFLEMLEKCKSHEKRLAELEELLRQKSETLTELRSEMADTKKTDDTWGDDDFTFGSINSLSKQMEQNEEDSALVQKQLLEVREKFSDKEQALREVCEELETIKLKLETQNSQTESLENSYKEQLASLREQCDAQAQRLNEVSEELKNKSLKFEKSKAVIKDRNNQIHRLQAQLRELQDKLSKQPEEEELPSEEVMAKVSITQSLASAHPTSGSHEQQPSVPRSEYEALENAYHALNEKYAQEKSNFEQTIARLETVHDGIQAKLHEDMSYIETLEHENAKFKEKICKLEECIATFEERRSSMERRANVLSAEMQSRADKYEATEDELIYRLNALSEHDDVIAQRLLDSQEEKDELQERFDKLHLDFADLSTRYSKLEKDYQSLKENMASDVDVEVQGLREELSKSEAELKRMRNVYDAKLAAKTTELDELENELSDQLDRMNTERRNLTEDLEKSRDDCTALKDEIVRLNESLNAAEQAKQESDRELTWLRMQNENVQQDQLEMQELRMQSIQDKTEIDNLRHQIDALATNHQAEMDSLRLQITELDSLRMQVGQNQTDDQVFIESENKRLTELLAEKEAVIKSYQRQNPSLEAGSVGAPSRDSALAEPEDEASRLLQQQLNALRAELEALTEANSEMQTQLSEKDREIDELRHVPQQAAAAFAPRNQPCDIIPAPPMFFSGLQAAPSPFDEIVAQSHERLATNAHAPDVVASRIEQQPTIEDLQRNVSDLEKHAQDLEIKLAQRTHYADELRERLNEAQVRVNILEREAASNGSKLQETLQRIATLEGHRAQEEPSQIQHSSELKAKDVEIEKLNDQLANAKKQLDASDSHLRELQTTLETERRLAESTKALESQIIGDSRDGSTAAEHEVFKREVAPTLDMFFGNSSASAEFDVIVPKVPKVSKEPVHEDPIVAEKAYFCFPKDTSTADAYNEAWGGPWGYAEEPVQEAMVSQKLAASTSQAAHPSASIHGLRESDESYLLQESLAKLEKQLAEQRLLTTDLQKRLRESEDKLKAAEQSAAETAEQLTHALHNSQQLSVLQQNIAAIDARAQRAESLLREREEELKTMTEMLASMPTQGQFDALQSQLEKAQASIAQREAEMEAVKKQLEEERQSRQQETALQSQIQPPPSASQQQEGNTATFKPDVALSLDAFFGNSSSAFDDFNVVNRLPPVSDQPVAEPAIVPEKAYLCHPTNNSPSLPMNVQLGLEIPEDDWAGSDVWGTQEANAEALHFGKIEGSAPYNRQQSLLTREQQLELQLQEQTERIQELEKTLQQSDQEKQELHVKSSKLMKKLKEYKVKHDELQQQQSTANFRKSSSIETESRSGSMFDDLDAAIQEELKQQISKLEADLSEQRKLQENANLEKEKLLKRIDVLTAGNERMSEMKERQDLDVQMYQARIRELHEKVNALENWDTEASVAGGSQGANANQQINAAEQQSAGHFFDAATVAPLGQQPSHTNLEDTRALNETIASLRAQAQELQADKQELLALLDEEKNNVQQAEASVKLLQQQLTASNNASDDLGEVTSRLLNLQDSYEKLNKSYMEQAQQLHKMDTLHKEQEQLLANLTVDLERSQGELLVLREELRSKEQALQELRQELGEAKASQQKNSELEALKSENMALLEKNAALTRQVEEQGLRLSERGNNVVTDNANLADELATQLQEKESEIMHLKQRIEDLMREDQTEKLVLEILTKNQEIHMLKIRVKDLEDDKLELEHNLSLQITKEMQNEKQRSSDDGSEVMTQLRNQIELQQKELSELRSEKSNMEKELEVLNAHVLGSLDLEEKMKKAALEIDMKNIEIAELRKSLETIKSSSDGPASSAAEPQVDVTALNSQWEAVVEQRCADIAQMWRLHTEQREAEFKQVEQRMQEEIANLLARLNNEAPLDSVQRPLIQQHPHHAIVDSSPTSATSTPLSGVSTSQSIVESATSSGADSKNDTPLRIINEADADALIEKMQAALESQEMEIVSLKEQLAIRSAEYAHLAAQHDPYNLQAAPRGNVDSPVRRAATGATNETNTALVPKSELDLALYVLHQRDMRCEEMTLELVSLLEERDTLQLKLSNTLRQMEAIKAQFNYTEPLQSNPLESSVANVAPITAVSTSSESPSTSSQQSISQGGAALSSDESAEQLRQKLSQLQTVNHSKDKLIKEERERRNRQMEKIQQDVAKIPPAAVSEIIGTDISHSNQSPSTALLNWLWGNKPQQPTNTNDPISSLNPNNQ